MKPRDRFFITRGLPAEGWSSFLGGSYGIPNRGHYLREADAQRNAQRIANERGAPCHVVVHRANGEFDKLPVCHPQPRSVVTRDATGTPNHFQPCLSAQPPTRHSVRCSTPSKWHA